MGTLVNLNCLDGCGFETTALFSCTKAGCMAALQSSELFLRPTVRRGIVAWVISNFTMIRRLCSMIRE